MGNCCSNDESKSIHKEHSDPSKGSYSPPVIIDKSEVHEASKPLGSPLRKPSAVDDGNDMEVEKVLSSGDVNVSITDNTTTNSTSIEIDEPTTPPPLRAPSPKPFLSPLPPAGSVDWKTFNGSWIQTRTENLDDYLTHMKVPFLIKKLIKSVKPKQELKFYDQGFDITMLGGPKPVNNVGRFNIPMKVKDPRGQEGMLSLTYTKHPVTSDVVIHNRFETKEGVDVGSRFIIDDELHMKMGPKISSKDGITVCSAVRIFKRMPEKKGKK